jgi:hypothetical protein
MKGRFLLAAALFASGATASEVWSFEAVAGAVQSRHLMRLEDVLADAPASFWSHYVLMRSSRSQQTATPQAPRVILVGQDGHFLVAFNGDPSLPGFDSLEMLQFRESEHRFELREILFPSVRNGLLKPQVSEPDPPRCLGCHRADPRPNWESYPTWIGAYGESDDTLSAEELSGFRDFWRIHGGDERYHRLERPEGSSVSPYSEQPFGDFAFRPNWFFTKLIARLQAAHAGHALLDLYPGEDGLVALSALLHCREPGPAIARRTAELLASGTATGSPIFDLLRLQGTFGADWSLSFVPPGTPEDRTDEAYRFFDGSSQLGELSGFAVARELSARYPALARLAVPQRYAYRTDQPGAREREMVDAINRAGGPLGPPRAAGICAVLGSLYDQ